MKNTPKKPIEYYIDQLQILYDRIPSFTCIKHCTDCCGPIFMTGLERALIVEQERLTSATNCPWRGQGHCRIYEKRPMICRLYGTVNEDRLLCSHGKAATFLLQPETAHRLLLKAIDLSIEAGFPRLIKTNEILDIISPAKIPIHLKGYRFND